MTTSVVSPICVRVVSPDTSQRELERLDVLHLVMVMIVGEKFFLAPIDEIKVQKVLDIGTGTGICEAYPVVVGMGRAVS